MENPEIRDNRVTARTGPSCDTLRRKATAVGIDPAYDRIGLDIGRDPTGRKQKFDWIGLQHAARQPCRYAVRHVGYKVETRSLVILLLEGRVLFGVCAVKQLALRTPSSGRIVCYFKHGNPTSLFFRIKIALSRRSRWPLRWLPRCRRLPTSLESIIARQRGGADARAKQSHQNASAAEAHGLEREGPPGARASQFLALGVAPPGHPVAILSERTD
jgi:hypothetical protein